MFTRVKESRGSEYLQIVESYRDGDRVRQRMVLYVGRYASLESALDFMPRDVGRLRRRAERSERLGSRWGGHGGREEKEGAERDRRAAEELNSRLKALRRLVRKHPDLLERDRGRAERQRKRSVW